MCSKITREDRNGLLDLSAAYDTLWHIRLLVKMSISPNVGCASNCTTPTRPVVSNANGQLNQCLETSNQWSPSGIRASANIIQTTIHQHSHASSYLLRDPDKDVHRAGRSAKWRHCGLLQPVQPSVTKTILSVFLLHNASASHELYICLKHGPLPVYLGASLDRTLTYRNRLKKTSEKVRTRSSLFNKLAGRIWEANTKTLRSSALPLCYFAAAYCAPVWCGSSHTKLVDIQLNSVMQITSGTLRSTTLPWVPILCNIAPTRIREFFMQLRHPGVSIPQMKLIHFT